jgi:hypothetical protein
VDHNRFSTSALCHAPLHPITLACQGIDIDLGDRYVVNGVILSEHAYFARQHPLQGWLTRFAFTPEKGSRMKKAPGSRKMGQLEQNKAS